MKTAPGSIGAIPRKGIHKWDFCCSAGVFVISCRQEIKHLKIGPFFYFSPFGGVVRISIISKLPF
jgi:hypothetical protein